MPKTLTTPRPTGRTRPRRPTETEPALALREIVSRNLPNDGRVRFRVERQTRRGADFSPTGGDRYHAPNGVELHSSAYPAAGTLVLNVRGTDTALDENVLAASAETWVRFQAAVAAYNAAWAARTLGAVRGPLLTVQKTRERNGAVTFKVTRQALFGPAFNPAAEDGRLRTFRASNRLRLRSNIRPEYDAGKKIVFLGGSKVGRRRDPITVPADVWAKVQVAVAEYNATAGAIRAAGEPLPDWYRAAVAAGMCEPGQAWAKAVRDPRKMLAAILAGEAAGADGTPVPPLPGAHATYTWRQAWQRMGAILGSMSPKRVVEILGVALAGPAATKKKGGKKTRATARE